MISDSTTTPNFFTLDIEEWYCVNYEGIDFNECRKLPSNLDASIDRLIELFGSYNVRTTCFILGQVGDEKPHIVKKLYDAGHEIACHGYGHQLVSRMRQGEFRDDLIRARTILEDITGESVIGYRAPSYSVNKGNIGWYYETLEELGFKYSSSIFPVRTFLYGIDGFPENMHYPVVNGRRRGVLEIPVPVVNVMGSRIGLYVRLFPSWFIIDFIKRRNRTGKPVFLYLHPREIDPEQPRLRLPMLTSLIHYWGIRGCDGKVENILRSLRHKFVRMRDILSEEMQ